MPDCKDCVNAIYDPTWGEYKCKIRQQRIYKILDSDDCKDYKKNNKKTKK